MVVVMIWCGNGITTTATTIDPSHAGMGGCIFEYRVCMCRLRLKQTSPLTIQSPHSQ